MTGGLCLSPEGTIAERLSGFQSGNFPDCCLRSIGQSAPSYVYLPSLERRLFRANKNARSLAAQPGGEPVRSNASSKLLVRNGFLRTVEPLVDLRAQAIPLCAVWFRRSLASSETAVSIAGKAYLLKAETAFP